MKRYIIRHVGNELVLSTATISARDNIAVPPDGAVFSEIAWAMLAYLCGATGTDEQKAATVEARIQQLAAGMGLVLKKDITATRVAVEEAAPKTPPLGK